MAGRGFGAFAAAHGIGYDSGARGRGRGSHVGRGRGGYSALERLIASSSAPPTHGAHDDATVPPSSHKQRFDPQLIQHVEMLTDKFGMVTGTRSNILRESKGKAKCWILANGKTVQQDRANKDYRICPGKSESCSGRSSSQVLSSAQQPPSSSEQTHSAQQTLRSARKAAAGSPGVAAHTVAPKPSARNAISHEARGVSLLDAVDAALAGEAIDSSGVRRDRVAVDQAIKAGHRTLLALDPGMGDTAVETTDTKIIVVMKLRFRQLGNYCPTVNDMLWKIEYKSRYVTVDTLHVHDPLYEGKNDEDDQDSEYFSHRVPLPVPVSKEKGADGRFYGMEVMADHPAEQPVTLVIIDREVPAMPKPPARQSSLLPALSTNRTWPLGVRYDYDLDDDDCSDEEEHWYDHDPCLSYLFRNDGSYVK